MNDTGPGRIVPLDPRPEAAASGPAEPGPAKPGPAEPRPAEPEGLEPEGPEPEGPEPEAAGPDRAAPSGFRAFAARPFVRQLAVFAALLTAGVVASWPRATYLATGQVPYRSDEGTYIWDLWWMAHQVTHLSNPWYTRAIAAPVGTYLGFHALMPVLGLVMMPVTLAFGAVFSFNLICLIMPGLLSYAGYRAARLWVPSQLGAIAAGAFFGLSANLMWRSMYHLNIAIGALFIPLALEAAVRLRRKPGRRQVVILGLVLGMSALADQEITILTVILTGAVLLPWLARRPSGAKLAAAVVAGLIGLILASPQIAAMVTELRAGGAALSGPWLVKSYIKYAVGLPQLFGPSPRVAAFGLTGLGKLYYRGQTGEGLPTFGLVLSAMAVLGLVVSWRRRSSWLLALGWLACAALALGPVLWIGTREYVPFAEVLNGVRVSRILPYTWFVRVPGMGDFREASRFTLLAIVPAAILAGIAVDWIRRRAAPLLVVVAALAVLEAGWTGDLSITPPLQRAPASPTRLAAVDGPIAADHSGSIVVDVPFGLWGGEGLYGDWLRPQALALATMDGHPRGEAYVSKVPPQTTKGIKKHAFYRRLVDTQAGSHNSAADLAAARADARRLRIGWVVVWEQTAPVIRYLTETGFRLDYRADGVWVYRPVSAF